MDKALVSNIQKFSIHDGEGIRTTIFFKGCGLHCLWCHNPESQSYKPQLIRYEERCVNCGECVKVCPNGAMSINDKGKVIYDREKCIACGKCVDVCAYDALEIAGKYYTADELVEEVKKDMIVYEESGGGVTLSGGEVMSQSPEFLLKLLKKLDRIGINIAIDTSGDGPWESYEKIAPYVDTFLYDLKTLDEEKHLKFIGKDLDRILNNLIKLNELEANINIRIPIIGKVNDELEELEKLANWLKEKEIQVSQINLLIYHSAGAVKYERLGMNYQDELMGKPSNEEMEKIQEMFKKNGFNNTIIGG